MAQPYEKTYSTDTLVILAQASRTGIQTLSMDSALMVSMQGRNVSDYLSMFTPTYIRSYGPGALASASIRGGSASHTQVLWNGMPLNNPMYGQSDLNLIPMNSANQISLQMGGCAILGGSGAVNGVIHLNNTPEFRRGLTGNATASFGSFQSRYYKAGVGFSNARFSARFQYWEQSAENNFRFKNTTLPGRPEVQQQNASIQNKGLQSGFNYASPKAGDFQLDLMYLNTHRMIPPLMHQAITSANQADEQLRSVLNWEKKGNLFQYKMRSGFSSEALYFQDSLSHIESNNRSLFQFSEAEIGIKIKNRHDLSSGLWQSYAAATADGYAGIMGIQKRYAMTLSYRYSNTDSNLQVSTHIRKEYAILQNNSTAQSLPLLPAIGIEKDVWKWLRVKSSASAVYRIPTLNDLYWSISGNPNLQAEKGWNADAGLDYLFKWKNITISPYTGIYYHHLDNRIQWQPGSFFWSPINIEQTRAQGIETHLKGEIKTSKYNFGIQIRYHKNRTYTVSQADKQLFYIPQNTTGGSMYFERNGWRILYSHAWCGFVYTSSDNSSWLPAYHTADISLERNIQIKKKAIRAWASCRNLMNIQYQIMEGRPMPGRGFWLGIDVNLNYNSL
jgi:vitamin B12 transporter